MSSLITTDHDFNIKSCCSLSHFILEEKELVGKNMYSFIRITPQKECYLIKNNKRIFCSIEKQPLDYIFRIKGTVSLLDPQEEEYLFSRTDKMTAITISAFGLITECLLGNEFLGFQPQEMMFRPIMRFVHKDDLVSLFGALKQPTFRSRIPVRWLKRPDCVLIPPAQIILESQETLEDVPSRTKSIPQESQETVEDNSLQRKSITPESKETPYQDSPFRRKSIAQGSYPLIPFENAKEEYQWVEITITKKEEVILFVRILDYSEIPKQPLLSYVVRAPKKLIRSTVGLALTTWRHHILYLKVFKNNQKYIQYIATRAGAEPYPARDQSRAQRLKSYIFSSLLQLCDVVGLSSRNALDS